MKYDYIIDPEPSMLHEEQLLTLELDANAPPSLQLTTSPTQPHGNYT
jgi:hypothetical protein